MAEDMISVVIPVYNECGSIAPLLEEVRDACSEMGRYEIVVVNDGSDDGTGQLLEDIRGRGFPELRIISMRRNWGQSAAMWAGFRAARGDIVVTLDGDGQNVPSDIPNCVDALRASDVCCGFRRNRMDSFSRRAGSRIANAVRRAVIGDGIADTGCSLKAFRAGFVKDLQYWDGMHRFLPALAMMQGAKITQIPVSHRSRTVGRSK